MRRCVSLDLEVGERDGRIHEIGAVRTDTEATFHRSGANLGSALDALDRYVDGAEYLLGHNIIEHDLRSIEAASPHLSLLRLPVIDTLRLNPLAFPAHPYHHLVKHYQDAGLFRAQRNDPVLDSRIALSLFEDQRARFRDTHPDLLGAWHFLCAPDAAHSDAALDRLFCELRENNRPCAEEAQSLIAARLAGAGCTTFADTLLARIERMGWPLAYALAWLSVAGGSSVIPPWVMHQFPEAGRLVRTLRD